MITPPVHKLTDARADFEELEAVETRMFLHEAAAVGVRVLRSPDTGDRVVLVHIQGDAETRHATCLVEGVGVQPSDHVIVKADEFEDGFAEAVEANVEGAVKITLHTRKPEDPEIAEAVAAVPFPERREAVGARVMISELDFEHLNETHGSFADFDLDDLRPVVDGSVFLTSWKVGYFLITWSSVMLARAFLAEHGFGLEVGIHKSGGYVIFTDFVSAELARGWAQRDLKQEMADRKVAESGDDLARLFHMPAHGEAPEESE